MLVGLYSCTPFGHSCGSSWSKCQCCAKVLQLWWWCAFGKSYQCHKKRCRDPMRPSLTLHNPQRMVQAQLVTFLPQTLEFRKTKTEGNKKEELQLVRVIRSATLIWRICNWQNIGHPKPLRSSLRGRQPNLRHRPKTVLQGEHSKTPLTPKHYVHIYISIYRYTSYFIYTLVYIYIHKCDS